MAHGSEEKSLNQKVLYPLLMLAGVTAVEFIVALMIPESLMPKPIKVWLYIVLTIVKAFYIVAFFMHLKFERAGLIYAIVVPTAFIVALIAALLYEGSSPY